MGLHIAWALTSGRLASREVMLGSSRMVFDQVQAMSNSTGKARLHAGDCCGQWTVLGMDSSTAMRRQEVRLSAGNFTMHQLADGSEYRLGALPADLAPTLAFKELWQIRPADRPKIKMPGKPPIPMPRWQQAYGHDYKFNAVSAKAQPLPAILSPYLRWSHENIDARLNGLLVNWYDGSQGHTSAPYEGRLKIHVADEL